MTFSHLHLTQRLRGFSLFLVWMWMVPEAADILSLIGSLWCGLLQPTFLRPLESFSIYSAEYISLSALESWHLQKIYLSSAGGTGHQFFFGVSSCWEAALCDLRTSHIRVDAFSVSCSIWIMATPAVGEWPIVLFLCFVISKLLFA
jgi:hypothetical protein